MNHLCTNMQYSSDEISVDSEHQKLEAKGLKYLPEWPSVNIEFQDLVYTVPDISGKFRFTLADIILIGIECAIDNEFHVFISLFFLNEKPKPHVAHTYNELRNVSTKLNRFILITIVEKSLQWMNGSMLGMRAQSLTI